MQSFQGIPTILLHDDGFVELLVPSRGFPDNVVGDDVQIAFVVVPTVVPVEADDVHETRLEKDQYCRNNFRIDLYACYCSLEGKVYYYYVTTNTHVFTE